MYNFIKKNFLLFLIIYIIIIIFQALFLQFYTIPLKNKFYVDNIYDSNLDDDDINNNRENIDVFLLENIKKRAELLKHMDIEEFLEYNRNNDLVKYENLTMYYFIWEKKRYPDGSVIMISRVYPSRGLEDITLKDMITKLTYNFPFTAFRPEEKCLDILYNYHDGYKYYWFDPLSNQSVIKKSFSVKIQTDNFDGFIGLGYNQISLSNEYSSSYFSDISKVTLFLSSLIIFISSIFISYFNQSRGLFLNLLIFLIIPNLYITYYLNIYENFSSYSNENDKLELINSGILSISFLVGMNIFILGTLSRNNKNSSSKNNIFLESVVIFSVAMILLLFSIFKYTNFNTLESLRRLRIDKQLTFNLVIIYNMFMVLYYLIYISKPIFHYNKTSFGYN